MDEHIFAKALAKEVAADAGFDDDTALDFLDALSDLIAEDLLRGEIAQIRDFGSFKTACVEAHEARNPKTGEKVAVEAHFAAHFVPSARLASAVNANYASLEPRLIAANAVIEPSDEADLADEEPIADKLPNDDRRGQKNGCLIWIFFIVLVAIAALFWLYFTGKIGGAKDEPITAEATIIREEQNQIVEEKIVATPDETTIEIEQKPIETAPKYAEYAVKKGDSLWSIAGAEWDEPYFWVVLFYDNPRADPDALEIGDKLKLREKPSANDATLLSEAHLAAARSYRANGDRAKADWTLWNAKHKFGIELKED